MSATSRTLRVATQVATLACLLGTLAFLARAASYSAPRVELRSNQTTRLSDAARARLDGLSEDALVSYFVSNPSAMPPELRRVQDEVALGLETLRAAAPERFAYQIVDPEQDPAIAAWLQKSGVRPYRTRRVESDGYVEQEVWSSLEISYGARPALVLDELGPNEAAHLPSLVLSALEQVAEPRAAVVALSAPANADESFERLAIWLSQHADVRVIDFDQSRALSPEFDLFFWLGPTRCEAEHLDALEDFVASGRSVVLAGSSFALRDGVAQASDFPATRLLRPLGLEPSSGPVCDERNEGAALEVRCIAPNQDFRSFRGQPNGSLRFNAATALEQNPSALAERGLVATVLATTATTSWLGELAASPPANGASSPSYGSKRALAVRLAPLAGSAGSYVVFGATTPFSDAALESENHAHRPLLESLWATLADDRVLARNRSTLGRSQALARLTPGARTGWRVFTTAALPLALLMLALLRRSLRLKPGHLQAATLAPLLALGAIVALVAFTPRLAWDVTRSKRHSLAHETRAWLDAFAPPQTATIELAFSADSRLQPELRPLVREARDLCAAFAQRSPHVELATLDVEQADLPTLGLQASESTSVFDEVTVVRRSVAALRVQNGERTTIIDCSEARHFAQLEYKLLNALAPRRRTLAVACDAPRLSPAEVQMEYQSRGLFAPTGSDVYAAARTQLAELGFGVTYIDPAAPPEVIEADALLWLQPRRGVNAMLERASAFLARGGRALIAAQHFEIVDRQMSTGSGEERWPQPQFVDVDRFYLTPLGIDLRRAVLFDELKARPESPAFDLRSSAANHAPEFAGADLVFTNANWIEWDAERLSERALTAQPLITTSARAWAYAWQGGTLPAQVLERASVTQVADASLLERKVPLAVRFEGRFPTCVVDAENEPQLTESQTAGTLLLIGSSTPFRAEQLESSAHQTFLARLAASLATPELSGALKPADERAGFDWVEPQARQGWRNFVLACAPVVLAALGLGLGVRRRRS